MIEKVKELLTQENIEFEEREISTVIYNNEDRTKDEQLSLIEIKIKNREVMTESGLNSFYIIGYNPYIQLYLYFYKYSGKLYSINPVSL